jgi:ribosome-binding factor A
MADPARARKVADRIKVLAAETIEHRIKDERLGFVTITDVRVTGDLQQASIFYTVFGSEQEREATAQALADNKGRIRSAIGKGLGIRLTPSIEFIPDAIPEGAAQIEDLLAQAKQRDAELAAAAAGAVHAGEADPYKRREDGELEDLDEDDEDDDLDEDLDSLDDGLDDDLDGLDDRLDRDLGDAGANAPTSAPTAKD